MGHNALIDVVLGIVMVRLSMSRQLHMKPQAQKRCHGDDEDESRQSSWEGVMPRSM